MPFFHLIRHKSIQNFIFLFLIQSSNILITLIAMPVLIQSVGVEQFGLVNLSFSVILLFNVLVSFGYNLSGPREIALSQQENSMMGQKLSLILTSKLVLAAISLTLILFFGVGFGFFKEYRILLFWSMVLLFSEATSTTWFFQGRESMQVVSMTNVFSKLLYLFLLVWLIQQPFQSYLANFFLGITGLISNLLLLVYIHGGLSIRLKLPGWVRIWQSWKDNLMLFFSGLASHIAVNGGLIILSFFASAQILGLYSMAEKIAMVLRIVPTLITQAAYPTASKLFVQDQKHFHFFLKKVQWTSLIFGLGISMLVFILAPQIIQLVSGNKLETSIRFLRVLAFLPFLASFNISNMLIILVTDQKKILFNSTWSFCLYMLGASILLTHYFGGLGLAFSLLTTEIFIFGISVLLLYAKSPTLIHQFYRVLFSSYRHP
ncbi:MAG: oligosaccharide flippase family protein [Cyclobacteriaceae bacterium]